MLGLYVHIPFCKKICPYCDFYKMVSNQDKKQNYIKGLSQEMKLKNLSDYSFDTVYIGGGTPSSLSLDLLEELFINLSNNINLDNLKEFTIEANPEDITEDFVKLIHQYNVSRVSIGTQTLNSRLQKLISREFSYEELKLKIKLLQKFDINNINLDLIYSIPGQTFEEFCDDLDKVISLDINHISAYSLILEEHTIFYHKYLKGDLKLNSEDLESKMYKQLIKKLTSNNFIHYEVSNFAKKGYQSLHNLIYWNCDEYVAIGVSASSYVNNIRQTNCKNMNKYLIGLSDNKIYLDEESYIDKEEAKKEWIILGLRKIKGIDKNKFALKFGENLKDAFLSIQPLINEGLLKENKNYLYIPKKYLYISNHILIKILSE